jgi:transposase-like protein
MPVRSAAADRLRDAGWLRRRYGEDGETMAAIAAELGCSAWTVQHWVHRHGIPTRPRGGSRLRPSDLEERVARGETVPEIARALGVSQQAVRERLRRRGLTAAPAHRRAAP